jgi:hypothetical protein
MESAGFTLPMRGRMASCAPVFVVMLVSARMFPAEVVPEARKTLALVASPQSMVM